MPQKERILIRCLELSAGELAVYSHLMYGEDRKPYKCWPSGKTIGKAAGVSKNAIVKYVRELEQKKLIANQDYHA